MEGDLQEILDALKINGQITEDLREKLKKLYGVKAKKAEELVNTLAVKRYHFEPSGRIIWIVVGREQEYYIIPRLYCQCDDFYINVVIRRKMNGCYHMLAQSIAERIGAFENFKVPDSDFIRLNSEWKKQSV
jgi:predicted nucleic acid-binding Zn finger protein